MILFRVLFGGAIILLISVGVMWLSITTYKRIEEKLKTEDKILRFNLFLAVPFFLFFLVGPFFLMSDWTDNMFVNIIFYILLVVLNGGFFLLMAAKRLMGVVWGFGIFAICCAVIGSML